MGDGTHPDAVHHGHVRRVAPKELADRRAFDGIDQDGDVGEGLHGLDVVGVVGVFVDLGAIDRVEADLGVHAVRHVPAALDHDEEHAVGRAPRGGARGHGEHRQTSACEHALEQLTAIDAGPALGHGRVSIIRAQ